ncbi:hypothetical protein DL89DRAFT_264901, partial [Linderina pennispora]
HDKGADAAARRGEGVQWMSASIVPVWGWCVKVEQVPLGCGSPLVPTKWMRAVCFLS